MKKTVNVNIGGISFIIDEDAYLEIRNYFEDIESRIENREERKEIMSDVESRVAEIFSTKLSPAVQVVDIITVRYVIVVIGSPQCFGERIKSEGYSGTPPPPRYNRVVVERRLMRDPIHRVLGGVCSGLGAYFGLETSLIRILAVVLFFCAGVGLLPYIIMWIAIPKAITQEEIDMLNYNRTH